MAISLKRTAAASAITRTGFSPEDQLRRGEYERLIRQAQTEKSRFRPYCGIEDGFSGEAIYYTIPAKVVSKDHDINLKQITPVAYSAKQRLVENKYRSVELGTSKIANRMSKHDFRKLVNPEIASAFARDMDGAILDGVIKPILEKGVTSEDSQATIYSGSQLQPSVNTELKSEKVRINTYATFRKGSSVAGKLATNSVTDLVENGTIVTKDLRLAALDYDTLCDIKGFLAAERNVTDAQAMVLAVPPRVMQSLRKETSYQNAELNVRPTGNLKMAHAPVEWDGVTVVQYLLDTQPTIVTGAHFKQANNRFIIRSLNTDNVTGKASLTTSALVKAATSAANMNVGTIRAGITDEKLAQRLCFLWCPSKMLWHADTAAGVMAYEDSIVYRKDDLLFALHSVGATLLDDDFGMAYIAGLDNATAQGEPSVDELTAGQGGSGSDLF